MEELKIKLHDILKNNSLLQNLFSIIYILVQFKKDRNNFFLYMSIGLKGGTNISQLLETYIRENKNEDMYFVPYLEKMQKELKEEGSKFSEVLRDVGMIDGDEFILFENINSAHQVLDYLVEKRKDQDSIRYALGMFFVPTILATIGFLVFQPEVKAWVEEMLLPINQYSTKLIEVPPMFQDRSTFFLMFLASTGAMLGVIFGLKLLRDKNPRAYFNLFKLGQSEFLVNSLSTVIRLKDAGVTYGVAFRMLSENSVDKTQKMFFKTLNDNFEQGQVSVHQVLRAYGFSKDVISLIKIGELNSNLDATIELAYEHSKKNYEKKIKKMSMYMPLLGELFMTLTIIIPLIEIIAVTTIGTMGFQV